jgi:hypothetical protein
MVILNLLDSGPSCSGPLLGPFESMRGGTPGTNPHQDKLANLNGSIRHQLMQLHPGPVQNIQIGRVRRHTETSSEEIFEHHLFIFMRIWNRLCTRRLGITLQKVVSETLQRHNAGLSNHRLPKIIVDGSRSSLSPNLHTPTIVGGSFAIAGAFRMIFLVRPSPLLLSGLH